MRAIGTMKYKRLKKNGDFSKLFKRGKKVFAPYLTVIYLPNTHGVYMGVALSKKHGKAVRRNRIKRLIRAAFSSTVPTLSGSYSMIILPKVCEEYTYKNFEKSLSSCFKRMNKSDE